MEIYKSLDKLNLNEKTSVALGNFDGIHIGHREIFRAALDAAKDHDLKSLCFTFSNHPFNFLWFPNIILISDEYIFAVTLVDTIIEILLPS